MSDSKATTRGWPPKRRREQAKRAHRQKPWKQSTGPRSPEGKAVVANNAYFHGFRSRDMAEIRRLLKRQKALIMAIFNASKGGPRPL